MANIATHAAKDVVYVEIRLLQRVGQGRRIGAVYSSPVIGHFPRACRKRDEDLAEPDFGIREARLQSFFLRQRAVAARVEDDQLDPDGVVIDDIDKLVERNGVVEDLLGRPVRTSTGNKRFCPLYWTACPA